MAATSSRILTTSSARGEPAGPRRADASSQQHIPKSALGCVLAHRNVFQPVAPQEVSEFVKRVALRAKKAIPKRQDRPVPRGKFLKGPGDRLSE
jgi:hypothetical protein